jgi:uncharacterized protein involved in exopolysaccharide biosynthesis/Mrp family chromosome partitioning ATPase
MLDPRNVRILSADEVLSDLNLNNAFLDTQVEVLRSNILLEEVIRQTDQDRLDAFDPANRPRSLVSRITSTLGRLLGPPSQGPSSDVALDPEMRRLERLVFALRGTLQVWREGDSYLINLTVTTDDPGLSLLFASRIVQVYIDRQVEERIETVRSATSFLADRAEAMSRAVKDAESIVEDFRADQLAQSGVSAETINQQLLDLSTQLALSRAEFVAAQVRFEQIQSVIERDGFEAAADLLTSDLVLSLRQAMLELRRRDADLATRLGPDHPDRARIAAEADLVASDLAAEVHTIVSRLRNDAEVARIHAQSLQDSLSELENRAADVSRASLQLRQLEREAEAVRASHQAILERLNETRPIEELQRADAKIVERAVLPSVPSSPRVKLFTALGGTAGLAVGLIAVFILAVTRAGFAHPAQIEQATGVPVLTSLPISPWYNSREMLQSLRRAAYQIFAERLRQLRTALLLRREGDRATTVMITSSVPGEGKTTTAVALAYFGALAKRSCVLVDFDLRHSRLGRNLDYAAPGDLAGHLRGSCPLDDAIHRVSSFSFDLITTKQPEPQLIDEVTPAQWSNLIAELESRYDLIVIDTAPLLLFSDNMPLARLADQTLLLVRQNSTSRRAVMEALRSLEEMGASSIGAVMTMVDTLTEEDTIGVSSRTAHATS